MRCQFSICKDNTPRCSIRAHNLLCVSLQASVMSGADAHFGGVTCISHTQNPIAAAQAVWKRRKAGRMSLGRVPPMSVAVRKLRTHQIE